MKQEHKQILEKTELFELEKAIEEDELEIARFGYTKDSCILDIINHIRNLDSDLEGEDIFTSFFKINQDLSELSQLKSQLKQRADELSEIINELESINKDNQTHKIPIHIGTYNLIESLKLKKEAYLEGSQ